MNDLSFAIHLTDILVIKGNESQNLMFQTLCIALIDFLLISLFVS